VFDLYSQDGRLFSRSTYKDGKRDGSPENHYSNGRVSEEANLREGKYDGPFVSYWDAGQLMENDKAVTHPFCPPSGN
jgi:antitoxin component YwqK of YwqJK toxin-antitoxin module